MTDYWRPLANGIWDNELPWEEELELCIENIDTGKMFASHSHRCPFLGCRMTAELAINLRNKTYIVLSYTEDQTIVSIDVDEQRNVVFFIFSDGKINVYSLNQDFEHIQKFKKIVPGQVVSVDFNYNEGSIILSTRQYFPVRAEFTETIYYNFRDIAYNALETKLPKELVEKIILGNQVQLMY